MGVFRCGVGGESGGEPKAPVSFCMAAASVCDTDIGWDVGVDFTVCAGVNLPVLVVLAVSVGTDINCLCLGTASHVTLMHLQVKHLYLVMSN